MIEVVPNWHPLLVHFPIALTVAAAACGLAALGLGQRPVAADAVRISRALLWLAALSALPAILAGMAAFSTVDHDDAGHLAMLRHREAALVSVGVLWLLALREAYCARRQRPWNWVSVALAAGVAVAFLRTGWLGGELVYRHGIGVLPRPAAAVPQPVGAAPAAATTSRPETPGAAPAPAPAAPAAKPHDHKGHKHAH